MRNNILVLKEVRKDLSEAENIDLDNFIKDFVKRFVEAEHRFIDLVFEMGDQEGMTKQDAKDFISYLGELRLFQNGLIPLTDVRENPLDWIDYILTGSTHTNFFESRVVDYSHSGLEGNVDYSKYLDFVE